MTKGIRKCISRMKDHGASPGGSDVYAGLAVYYSPSLDEVRCYTDAEVYRNRVHIEAFTTPENLETQLEIHDETQEFVSSSICLFHCDRVMTTREIQDALDEAGVQALRTAYLMGVPLRDILA